MQKNKFLLLLALSLVGCSQRKEAPTFLSKLVPAGKNTTLSVHRSLASGANKCVADLFTVETLKAQVEEEEKKFEKGKKVSGTWKHLNLSQLPIPQANFLKTYGNEIGDVKNPDSVDYSGCDSVPCIYNRIYGKENHIAGYVHYLWYLKLGHMLSADNSVPYFVEMYSGAYPTRIASYNGKNYELKDYLYNDEELYGMWRLTMMLDKSHAHLTNLRETQRLPRGSAVENTGALVCGQASSGGWIILQDACLRINKDYGYLYQAVTHELSHQVDFLKAKGWTEPRESETTEYLQLTGFTTEEYQDKDGKTKSRWKLPASPQLVSSYGHSSPAESFAEDLALFRHEGDLTKQKIKHTHYNFVSEKFYSKKLFDSPSFFGSWLNGKTSDLSKGAFKAVVDCTQSSAKFKSTFLTQSDFQKRILPSMLNCLSMQAETLSGDFKADISIQEPEGCRKIQDYASEWNKSFKSVLVAQFERYLNEIEKDQSYLANIQKFYNDLADNSLALDAYVQCYDEADIEQCFSQESNRRATAKALNLGIPEGQAAELGESYANYHSFVAVKQASDLAYLNFVRSHEETIRENVQATWDSCGSIAQNDSQPPTGKHFQVTSGYMISSYYNCLNAQYPQLVKDVVRDLSVEGQKVQNAKEELILTREVKPHVNKILDALYTAAKEVEFQKAQEFLQTENGALRAKIISGFSWVSDVLNSSKVALDCQKEAYKEIGFSPNFHLKKDIFSDYIIQNVCQGIDTSDEYKKWLDSSKEEFTSKAYSTLENNITQQGEAVAKKCLAKYPTDTNLNRIKFKKEREACLMDGWMAQESTELSKYRNDPLVQKFDIDVNGYKEKLESNRRRLQLKVIKEYF